MPWFGYPSAILPDSYTLSTLPDPATNLRKYAWASDLYGGPGDYLISDGYTWKPVRPFKLASMAAANMTVQPLVNAPLLLLTGNVLTGTTVTITLGTTYAYSGAMFRIVRQATGLGTLVASVGLPMQINGWQEYGYDGSNWQPIGAGGLLG